MKDYIEQASRTCLDDQKNYANYVDATDFERAMQSFAHASNTLEKIKKQIFYGRGISRIPTIYPVKVDENVHANLGIAGESIELIDANTREDVLEEAGDMLWYIAKKLKAFNLTFEECMEFNIEKLKKRYPERYK